MDPEEVITTALQIIDDEGLTALSLRRLGTELGVTGTALYHHFADKDAILRGVVESVLAREILPTITGGTWEEYVTVSVTRYYSALLAHPNVAPLLRPHGQALDNPSREYIVTLMFEAGVPEQLCYPIIDSIEMLAFGSAMTYSRRQPLRERLGLDGRRGQPNLRKAVKATPNSPERLFRLEVEAMMTGWKALIAEQS
ncbi:TetR family transcriptional regulator [Nocardia sp. BMG111209]|uniref:TetR/AcrR family transcriptional regulator n=1 Tax=Nocardia sp. BMG111209 TaxID=1160137 RepID=UPI00039EC556|nr:TetR family transcriptional regulator [Nocardia sp. BMG111209]